MPMSHITLEIDAKRLIKIGVAAMLGIKKSESCVIPHMERCGMCARI
jgi:hypothetical protein